MEDAKASLFFPATEADPPLCTGQVRAPHEGAMRWLAAVPVPLSTSLVSEGHTLVPVEAAGALLAFGGYNDRCVEKVMSNSSKS
jgi:hypothetical protein